MDLLPGVTIHGVVVRDRGYGSPELLSERAAGAATLPAVGSAVLAPRQVQVFPPHAMGWPYVAFRPDESGYLTQQIGHLHLQVDG